MPPRRRSDARPGATRRAVLYLRQSTPRDESVSMEQQETACRDHCARHGYVVVGVEQDGVTGQTWRRRPGVQRAMTALDDRTADVLVLWKWSRLARRSLDFEVALDRARAAGGEIESATEAVDTKTAAGRFQRGVLSQVAAFEAERIGEGWEETHARRRAQGEPAQGGDRYGYRRERGDDGRTRYRIDEEQADVLRWAYARVIEGRGSPWVAAELNRQGVPNPAGNPWSQKRVFVLLDSGFAAGLLIHSPRDDRNRPVGPPTYHPGNQPPIITTETWEAYQLARRARAGRPPREVEGRYPLSGLVKCGDCGASMWPSRAHGRARGHSYVCSAWQQTRLGRCVTAVRALVEAAVLEWLRDYAADVGRAAEGDQAVQDRALRAKRDARDAARRAASLQEQLGRLTRLRAADEVSALGYEEARRQLEREASVALEEAEAAELVAGRRTSPASDTAANLLDEWDELPAVERRNILGTLISRVEVHPPERRGGRSTFVVVPIWQD